MYEQPAFVHLSLALLFVLVVGQGFVLLGVVGYLAKVQARLPVALVPAPAMSGHPAPQFRAFDLAGREISTMTLRGKLAGLLFVSPHCPSCMTTLAELHYISHKVLGNLVVVCKGGERDCAELARRYELSVPTIPDENDWLGALFEVSGTPTVIMIDEDYRIMSRGEPGTTSQFRDLLSVASSDGDGSAVPPQAPDTAAVVSRS